jgi:hypothetical protein
MVARSESGGYCRGALSKDALKGSDWVGGPVWGGKLRCRVRRDREDHSG